MVRHVGFPDCRTAANKFVDMGCSVFPLRPHEKKPMFSWDQFKTVRPTHEQVDEWFDKTPDANLALVCGAISGIVVVDVDGAEGQQWFVAHGFKTNLFQYTSNKHKFHAFYRHPGEGIKVHPSVKQFHPQIDVRGDGSYVVVSPSIHPSGATYDLQYLDGFTGPISSLPVLPDLFWKDDPENAGKTATADAATSSIELEEGARNSGMTSKCGEWYARGLAEDEVESLAQAWNERHVSPPLSRDEVATIVRSMFKTHNANNPGLLNTDGVQGWVARAKGDFSINDVYRDLGVAFASDKARVRRELDALVAHGVIELSGNRDGFFTKVDRTLDMIDLDHNEGEEVKIKLPFGLHHTTRVFPGNLIVIAGETNSGKTSLLLNMVAQNWDVQFRYLSSEMTSTELQGRLRAFGISFDQWKAHCEFVQRSEKFDQAIDPDGINIIDYLEMTDEFFKIGKYMNDIFRKLKKGIAIVTVQKKRGERFGRGGEFGLEKARLGLSLFSHGHLPNGVFGSCVCTKAKNIRMNNPQDKEIFYRLKNGTEYDLTPPKSCPSIRMGWSYYDDATRKKILGEIENCCKAAQKPDEPVEDEF